ncbi:hypothetical protein [Nocardioides psychrotolerans]|uniref:maltokinase N-terminal cap-like domain-containing protein n=1 Tax=Nocardioides psychrotolerans TaxID=1005945 RepID=UPI003137B3C2
MTTEPSATQIDHVDPQVFVAYVEKTRWFGGKGRPFTVTGVRRLGELAPASGAEPSVALHLVELTYDDVAVDDPHRVEHYQVPLAFYAEPETRLDHAFVGWWEEPGRGWVHAYDALHDRAAMACWLDAFAAAADAPDGSLAAGGLVFHRIPGHAVDTTATSTLFTGEQSNSSVSFGEDAVMKVFRKVTPGINPDVRVHDVLTRAGSEHVAALYGWVEHVSPDGDVTQLAMLQQFLRTATDGWDIALTSVRNLFAEADLHANEVGGDFAGESARLGEALREVHDALAEHFPTGRGSTSAAAVGAAMSARLDAALAVVPDLASYADGLHALYGAVAALPDVEVQQIHGDLHLGQTLRTALGWKIVDFEGEPAKTLAERSLPDSRWRDVAGMLRSLDYAPHVVERTRSDDDLAEVNQRNVRAYEWAHRNRNHFLVAYAGGEVGPDERVLLDAYVADKAVYECVYEKRNRPTWISIPLEAIARIVTT